MSNYSVVFLSNDEIGCNLTFNVDYIEYTVPVKHNVYLQLITRQHISKLEWIISNLYYVCKLQQSIKTAAFCGATKIMSNHLLF